MAMTEQSRRTTGLGPNALFHEASHANAKAQGGFVEDHLISLGSWRSKTGLSLTATAAATPYIGNIAIAGVTQGVFAITWRQDAAATDFIQCGFQVPGQYDPTTDQLYFIAAFRKYDVLADENATLAMQIQMRQFRASSADPALAATVVPATTHLVAGETVVTPMDAVVKRTLATFSQTLDGFANYQFDLGFNKRGVASDALHLKPLELVQLEIGPDATVGTTDMQIEMLGGMIRWFRNTSLNHETRRNLLDGSARPSRASLTISRYIE